MTTLSVGAFIKTLGDVHSRLFDHRPVLHGEIHYFVKEFEGRTTDRLETCLEYSNSISSHLKDVRQLQLEHYLPHVLRQVNEAAELASRIEENREKPERIVWLNERRQQRVDEWSSFMNNMCDKSSAVDLEMDNELSRVSNYYTEMEKKLNITETVN